MYRQYTQYQPSQWQQVLTHMQNSMYALELQCSYATQMKVIPETKGLPGLKELHRENYETSYHRTTALGSLYRLIQGDHHPFVVGSMIRCMMQSEHHDLKQRRAIQSMSQAASGNAVNWVNIVNYWQTIQLSELRAAMNLTRQIAGEAMWQYGKSLEY